jgi:D-alanyl-D-alanine carboxypeptidase
MAYDRRAIIVARPAVATAMNQAAATIDTLGGSQTFTVPLRTSGDATNTIVGYWCSWALTAALVTQLRTALQNKGATASEATVILAGQTPTPGNRVYFFDGREGIGWSPDSVLAALGADRLSLA